MPNGSIEVESMNSSLLKKSRNFDSNFCFLASIERANRCLSKPFPIIASFDCWECAEKRIVYMVHRSLELLNHWSSVWVSVWALPCRLICNRLTNFRQFCRYQQYLFWIKLVSKNSEKKLIKPYCFCSTKVKKRGYRSFVGEWIFTGHLKVSDLHCHLYNCIGRCFQFLNFWNFEIFRRPTFICDFPYGSSKQDTSTWSYICL